MAGSKSAAILGGQTSALEAIQTAQSGQVSASYSSQAPAYADTPIAASALETADLNAEKELSTAAIKADPFEWSAGVGQPEPRITAPVARIQPKITPRNIADISTFLNKPVKAAPARLVQKTAANNQFASAGIGLPSWDYTLKLVSEPVIDLPGLRETKPATVRLVGPIRPQVSGYAHIRKTFGEPQFGLRSRRSARKSATVFTGRPDVFGSRALAVSRTPLDGKWHKVSRSTGVGRKYLAAIRASQPYESKDKMSVIRSVNAWVNKRVEYTEDKAFRGRNDHWALPSETLRVRKGDCEDYALAKMQLLAASGIKSKDMFLVIAKDLVRRADHALLVVQLDGQMLVLDNETDRILNADDVRDYRPIMSYSSSGKWLHGYKAKPRSTQMAALSINR